MDENWERSREREGVVGVEERAPTGRWRRGDRDGWRRGRVRRNGIVCQGFYDGTQSHEWMAVRMCERSLQHTVSMLP